MVESNICNEQKALVEKIKSIVSNMVKDLTKNIEKISRNEKEKLFQFSSNNNSSNFYIVND